MKTCHDPNEPTTDLLLHEDASMELDKQLASKTPRCDAEERRLGISQSENMISATFARKLELETAALTKQVKMLRGAIEPFATYFDGPFVETVWGGTLVNMRPAKAQIFKDAINAYKSTNPNAGEEKKAAFVKGRW